MTAIVIHGEHGDTAAVVANTENLEGVRFTEIEYDGSTEYMRDRDDIKTQFRSVIDEVMGIIGFVRATK